MQLVSVGDLVSISVLAWLVLVNGRHWVSGKPSQQSIPEAWKQAGVFPLAEVCPGHHCRADRQVTFTTMAGRPVVEEAQVAQQSSCLIS